MKILSRVAAEFHDPHGLILFQITPRDMNHYLTAPDAIRQDPLFSLLLAEGSLDLVESASQLRALENDPLQGHSADGRALPPTDSAAETAPKKSARTGKSKSAGAGEPTASTPTDTNAAETGESTLTPTSTPITSVGEPAPSGDDFLR